MQSRARLLAMDGVLVWVDPLSAGKDRSRLDPLLRDVAVPRRVGQHPSGRDFEDGRQGGALPNARARLGYRHRPLSFRRRTSTRVSLRVLRPAARASSSRTAGNGGQGVWKVELVGRAAGTASPDTPVRVLHALRGSVPEELALGAFMNRCHAYFERRRPHPRPGFSAAPAGRDDPLLHEPQRGRRLRPAADQGADSA